MGHVWLTKSVHIFILVTWYTDLKMQYIIANKERKRWELHSSDHILQIASDLGLFAFLSLRSV